MKKPVHDHFGKKNPMFGRKHSAETKDKIRQKAIGRKVSEETKKKIRQNANRHWLGKKLPESVKAKMRGRLVSAETRRKNGAWQVGRKLPESTRRKLSEALKGSKSPLWRGGMGPVNKIIRESFEYRLWREAVFKRDNWSCVIGGKEHGNKLQADHIKPFALFPELRLVVDNGRTLCKECHKKTESYGWNGYRLTTKKATSLAEQEMRESRA